MTVLNECYFIVSFLLSFLNVSACCVENLSVYNDVLFVVISPVSAAALRGVALTRGRATALAARGVYNAAAAAQLQAAALRPTTALPTATALPYAT